MICFTGRLCMFAAVLQMHIPLGTTVAVVTPLQQCYCYKCDAAEPNCECHLVHSTANKTALVFKGIVTAAGRLCITAAKLQI